MIDLIRRSFSSAKDCEHGGKVRELASILGAEPLDFSANINPLGFPPIDKLLERELKLIGHYPDNNYIEFRKAAAKFVGQEMDNIVPGNGSSELIRLFAETTLGEGDLALIPFPTFGEYENQSFLAGAAIKKIKLDQDGMPKLNDSDLKDAKVIFLCNPNNPTGRLLSSDIVLDLAGRCEKMNTFLLVDEAFIELSDPSQSVSKAATEMEFLFVMRSLTKSFGVPGLRLGFGITNAQLAPIMNRARIPWSISALAASAGEYLLSCNDHLVQSRDLIKKELTFLTHALEELELKPLPSRVNFILVDIKSSGFSSQTLAERTMAQGVLVRDCRSFGLGNDYIRVAVRNRKDNLRLITALERAL